MVILPSIRRKYMTRRDPGGKIPLGDAVITLDKDVWQYTGSAITPTPVVTLYGNLLTVNVDFTVGYTGNVEVGQGVVTVTGMGQYSGQRQKSFVIEAAPAPSGWDFDVADATFAKRSDWSNISSTVRNVSFSSNGEDAISTTGTDKYLRHLKVSGYDPDTVENILLSHEGKGYDFVSSPDGSHVYASKEAESYLSRQILLYQFNIDRSFNVDEIPNISSATAITSMQGMQDLYTLFVVVSNDGLHAITGEYNGSTIHIFGYSLQTPFDLTTASLVGNQYSESGTGDTPPFKRIAISPDGLYFASVKFSLGGLHLRKYKMSIPYDFSTTELEGENVISEITYNYGLGWCQIDSSGTNAICGDGSGNVFMLNLKPQN